MRTVCALLILFLLHGGARGQDINWEQIDFKARDGNIVPAERGTFHVPENKSKPNGKKLSLSFIRFKSTSPAPGYPIVYLAGGPGGSGSGAAAGKRIDLFYEAKRSQ